LPHLVDKRITFNQAQSIDYQSLNQLVNQSITKTNQ